MKIAFVSPYCLLDPSSGASISCRTILEKLASRGHEAYAVSATIFDRAKFAKSTDFLHHLGAVKTRNGSAQRMAVWRASSNKVTHIIAQSDAQRRRDMTCWEEESYQHVMKEAVLRLKPDLILTYGGKALDRDSFRWFKDKQIPTVFYLANANYRAGLAFRDIDLVITDTEATATFYETSIGMKPLALGKFVEPVKLSANAAKDCITFINPTPAKGAAVFVAIAREAMRRGMPTKFLVVQSRGNLGGIAKALGFDLAEMHNISCVPVQEDMTAVWSRTKILLCPSLWHESGARTIVEACSAGIPVLATDTGGSAELLGEGGFVFPVPTELKEKYLTSVSEEALGLWMKTIEKLMGDEMFFRQASERARRRWKTLNEPDPIIRLEKVFQTVIGKKRVARS